MRGASLGMLGRLGLVLIVGLRASAVRVNREAAECASVLKVGEFRRLPGQSPVVKRCEDVSSSTTSTTSTDDPRCEQCDAVWDGAAWVSFNNHQGSDLIAF